MLQRRRGSRPRSPGRLTTRRSPHALCSPPVNCPSSEEGEFVGVSLGLVDPLSTADDWTAYHGLVGPVSVGTALSPARAPIRPSAGSALRRAAPMDPSGHLVAHHPALDCHVGSGSRVHRNSLDSDPPATAQSSILASRSRPRRLDRRLDRAARVRRGSL